MSKKSNEKLAISADQFYKLIDKGHLICNKEGSKIEVSLEFDPEEVDEIKKARTRLKDIILNLEDENDENEIDDLDQDEDLDDSEFDEDDE